MDAGLGALLGAVAGYLLRPLGDWLKDVRTSRRNEARHRADSQRETLIALQAALRELSRRAHAALYSSPVEPLQVGRFGAPVPPEWQHQLAEAYTSVKMLRVLVDDEELRTRVATFEKDAVNVALSTSSNAMKTALEVVSRSFNTANERLGELLRGLQ